MFEKEAHEKRERLRQQYESYTDEELKGLQKQSWQELERLRHGGWWRGLYYIVGLISVMAAVLIIILEGIDTITAAALLIGGPAIWMWKRDDGELKFNQSLHDEVTKEIQRRDGYAVYS